MTWVKVCGLTTPEAVEVAEDAGADLVGFVIDPSSKRYVNLDEARSLVAVCRSATPVLVSGVMQGNESVPGCWRQASEFPGGQPDVPTLLALRATGATAVPDGPYRAIVLDKHKAGMYGGTGETLDWYWAADFVARCPLPVILAGGLGPDNVARAVETVRPAGVDASSRLETAPGRKDPVLVAEFVRVAQEALRRAHPAP